MSHSYYWFCPICHRPEKLRGELFAEETSPQKQAGSLETSGHLKKAVPYYDMEVVSNRPQANRRCKKCDRWHHGGMQGPGYPKVGCGQHVPHQVPACEKENCAGKMNLLFVEKDAFVIVDMAFSCEKPLWLGPDSAYDAYLYRGRRCERQDDEPWEVVSSVYFSSRYGKRYGTYSPYFLPDYFFSVVEEMRKSR
jgi:hypothetical protein